MRKVKPGAQRVFAAIPLLFAMQQFTEGFVWLSLTGKYGTGMSMIPIYIFLVFAQVVWPIWVPLSMYLLETGRGRRTLLLGITGIGFLVAGYVTWGMFFYPVGASVSGMHIQYSLGFPLVDSWMAGVFYFIPTVIPLFISGHKKMFLLGLTIFLSYVVSELLFEGYVISVWCFFAAIISAMVYYLAGTLTTKKIN